jgi:tripartite-type tricarboxylate transporter receptor subunit TctC
MLSGFRRLFILAISAVCIVHANYGHAETHEFFKGKTVRIVVGFSAGGAFDVYSRTIARYMGQYIPGNPAIIVENMTGAGSLVAANHLYKAAAPDGLAIGNFIGGLFVGQVLGRPGIEFDARKFEYLGSPMRENTVCVTTKASRITTIDNWRTAKAPVKIGATAPGASTYDSAAVVKAALNLPIQIVSGYKGAPEIRFAMQSGELEGTCTSWESIRVTSRSEIQSGDAVVVMQMTPTPHPELVNVPLAIDVAKTERSRQLIQAGIHDVSLVVRPYALPPGTPKTRVQILRKAFADTLQDSKFLADARKSNLDLEPITGEDLERTVAKLFKISPTVRDDLSTALLAK